MGLFSFLKNVGSHKLEEKAVANDAANAETNRLEKIGHLEGILRSTGIEISDLSVDLANDDTVVVYGQTESQDEKEKVILVLGNIDGVASVDDRISVVTSAPEAQFYEVQGGDSLSKIAKQFYGDPMKYKAIFEANQPMLSDPNKIFPGQTLRIPNL